MWRAARCSDTLRRSGLPLQLKRVTISARLSISQLRAVKTQAVITSQHVRLGSSQHLDNVTRSTSLLDMPKRKRQGIQTFSTFGGTRDLQGSLPKMPRQNMSSTTRQYMTDVRFDSLPLTAETQRALETMKYETCTNVQAASLPVFLSGVDLVCKAKTGTGKTLAFLIPAIERLKRAARPARGRVSIVVLSPTRELAQQIADEAGEVIRSHGLVVQSVVGGTSVNRDVGSLNKNTPNVLVATPGRMVDLLQSHGLAGQLVDIQCLILDEADRLLDMGFKPDITRILSMLPPKDRRQTALFSATFPKDIQQLARSSLRPGFDVVDTVGETEDETAEKIQQAVVVSSMADLAENMLSVLRAHQKSTPGYKVMAFFTTARLTAMYASLFSNMGLPVLQIHSRMSQPQRTRAADAFRQGDNTILFSSDVSARGVDYPDVSLVLQVGLPTSRDQYIHRVGRTARAGKKGEAILILQDFEQFFVNKLAGLPVKQLQPLDSQTSSQLSGEVNAALQKVPRDALNTSYQAWLGYYKGSLKLLKWTPAQLVQQANEMARVCLGLTTPPPILKKTVGMMGMKGVPGLNIVSSFDKPGGSVGNSGNDGGPGKSNRPGNNSRPSGQNQGKRRGKPGTTGSKQEAFQWGPR